MKNAIKNISQLGFPWKTQDPFLFCVHHLDHYPAGNKDHGPDPNLLKGRNIGNDFTLKDGWRMYHGQAVPGFPVHPHRGFETITINMQGFVDHADSLKGAGRFGKGDVQWMTAGKGIQHSEMFPLLNKDNDNTLEIFQIWLNLPCAGKFVEPYYKMLWNEQIPVYKHADSKNRITELRIIAGGIDDVSPLEPTPDSWAADPESAIAVWVIKMEPGANFELPLADKKVNRALYFYKGSNVGINEEMLPVDHFANLEPTIRTNLMNGNQDAYLLLLQGKPINEPVVQYGPFVMNTQAEIMQAFKDYQRDHFGGWPWTTNDPVHHPGKGRFARYPDGSEELF